MIRERYKRNSQMLTGEENESLSLRSVCVIGCGGLGGYVIEMLGRLGIGTITAIDGDVFDESNLNRQILSHPGNLKKSKAEEAKARMALVNPYVKLNAIGKNLDEKNADKLLSGSEVAVDALDSIAARILLQEKTEKLGIPLVHGSIAGWYGQVTTILPGDRTLEYLYPGHKGEGEEKILGNPSFTPALVASLQVSEVLKILIGRGTLLRKKLLIVNTLEQEFETIEIN
ncbi:MAG: HesA/MoeB/ThiF family protein [Spirochaetales bacterium]|nr:HesA/MoeB/ThiF family protein [Spirochaetales bacterium]